MQKLGLIAGLLTLIVSLSISNVGAEGSFPLSYKDLTTPNSKNIEVALGTMDGCATGSRNIVQKTPSSFTGSDFATTNTIFILSHGEYPISQTLQVGSCSTIIGGTDVTLKASANMPIGTPIVSLSDGAQMFGGFLDGNGLDVQGISALQNSKISYVSVGRSSKGIVLQGSSNVHIEHIETASNGIGIFMNSSSLIEIIDVRSKNDTVGGWIGLGSGIDINGYSCTLGSVCLRIGDSSDSIVLKNISSNFPALYSIGIANSTHITLDEFNAIGNKLSASNALRLEGGVENVDISHFKGALFNEAFNSIGIPTPKNINVSWAFFQENEVGAIFQQVSNVSFNNTTLFNNGVGVSFIDSEYVSVNNSIFTNNGTGLSLYGSGFTISSAINNSLFQKNTIGMSQKQSFGTSGGTALNNVRIVNNGTGSILKNINGLYYGSNLIDTIELVSSALFPGTLTSAGWGAGTYGNMVDFPEKYSVVPMDVRYSEYSPSIGRQPSGTGAFKSWTSFTLGDYVPVQDVPARFGTGGALETYGLQEGEYDIQRKISSNDYVYSLSIPGKPETTFVSENSMTIGWTGGADTYDISVDGGKTFFATGIVETTKDILGLRSATVYEICVRGSFTIGLKTSCSPILSVRTNRLVENLIFSKPTFKKEATFIEDEKIPRIDEMGNIVGFDALLEDPVLNQNVWKLKRYMEKLQKEDTKKAIMEVNGFGFIPF